MKNVFLIPAFLLAFVLQLAAVPVTVIGLVTDATTGTPKSDWPVEAMNLDSFPGSVFASGSTDVGGLYSFEIEVPVGTALLLVSTVDCNGVSLAHVVPILNDTARADFVVCADPPPFDDCWVQAWFNQTSPNTLEFFAYGYSLDSLENFTYTWDFGDGSTSTEQNPTHTYATGGFYTATVTATSPSCTTTTELFVFIDEIFNGPTDTITVSGYVHSLPDSLPVAFWGVYAAGVSPNFPSFAVTDSLGFYTMQVVIPEGDSLVEVETYDCTGVPVIQYVPVVNGSATANFDICFGISPFPGCSALIFYEEIDSLTYQFYANYWSSTDSVGTNLTYFWDFGDGSTSTEAEPIHTYATDGIYTVSLTVEGDSCLAYACEIICTQGGGVIDTFWYGCQAMFWAEIDPALGSNTIHFIDATFGAVASWNWDFGDGATSTEQNPTHTYASDGIYLVTLHITTVDGCESEITMEVWVGSNPWNEFDCQALFLPLPDSLGSNGFYFFDFSYAPVPVVSWQWDFGDGSTSTEQSPYHAYAQAGIYNVTLTILTADSCSSQISIPLDTENPMQITDANAPALGLSGNVSSTVEKPVFEKLTLFPNPASTVVNLAFSSLEDSEYEWRVLDLAGKTVFSTVKNAAQGENLAQINLGQLPQGMYVAQILTARGVQSLKFSKQ